MVEHDLFETRQMSVTMATKAVAAAAGMGVGVGGTPGKAGPGGTLLPGRLSGGNMGLLDRVSLAPSAAPSSSRKGR